MTDAPDQSPVAPPRALSPKWLSMTALAFSIIALGLAALPYANGGGDFGGKVRSYLLAHPEVLDEVVQARDARAATDRITATNAAARANPASLAAGPGEPAFGPQNARVTVVQFFDYRCPYCKSVAPAYVALMRAHPDVRFIFKEWPILDQGAGVTSQYAARGALAAHAQGRYLAVHSALMAEGALSPQAVDRILAALGSPATSRILADVHTGAATLGLQGTPTFFINGRLTASNDPAMLDRAIRAAKAG
jgi:protein-disulfide isomerase